MKTTVRHIGWFLPACFTIVLALLFPRPSVAQGNLNALVIDPSGTAVGYASQGVGWSFVTTVDLFVTGISSTAPQVDFWQGSNQVIATYNYFGPYYSGGGASAPTNFQTVSSFFLSAGQTYFISTQQPGFSSAVIVEVYGLYPSGSVYGPKTFSISPYLSQFASYNLSSNGQWSSTTTPASDNVNYVVLGPNFQFQVVPEPTSFELFLFAAITWLFLKRPVSNFLHARQILQLF